MADQHGLRATFMRGGTSKGLFFRREDVPGDRAERDAFLCAAMGAGDPYGRQLDGMGGGISSLSKAMMVGRSRRDGVDIDYLFAQVGVGDALVDYGGNCGNLSAAVGAYAVDQGFVQCADGPATVRMFNENTGKRIDCHLTVRDGRAAVSGTEEIAGVAGCHAAIRLDFLDPGGTKTDALLPLGEVERDGVSFVDAANPCVFVDAQRVGLTAAELPSDIAAMPDVLARLDVIRREAGVAAGMAPTTQDVARSVPKIALVGPPAPSVLLTGETLQADAADVQIRMVSMGAPHLAIPLTGAMCTAVAERIPGSVVNRIASAVADGAPLRIATASGVVPARAEVREGRAVSASVYRTARTLMEGMVYAPLTPAEAAE